MNRAGAKPTSVRSDRHETRPKACRSGISARYGMHKSQIPCLCCRVGAVWGNCSGLGSCQLPAGRSTKLATVDSISGMNTDRANATASSTSAAEMTQPARSDSNTRSSSIRTPALPESKTAASHSNATSVATDSIVGRTGQIDSSSAGGAKPLGTSTGAPLAPASSQSHTSIRPASVAPIQRSRVWRTTTHSTPIMCDGW
jgi:hypothetical protein